MNIASERTKAELVKLEINNLEKYFKRLSEVMVKTEVTWMRKFPSGELVTISLDAGIGHILPLLEKMVSIGKKRLMIIGNGGSAALAIHMLMDFINAGDIKTMDFTSPALLTCMANDYGYENVFAKPIEKFANEGDIIFAISSSGESKNILKACDAAVGKGCTVITFSGMNPDNQLRSKGFVNFYVPSTHYGFVELSHEAILHGILDLFIRFSRRN